MSNLAEIFLKPCSDTGSGLRAVPTTQPPESTGNAPRGLPEALEGVEPCLIASWLKNGRETLQVKLDNFKGHAVIDCRAWYAGAGGELKPGRGGLTISVKHLPALASALAKALDVAIKAGLVKGQQGGDL